MKKGLILFALTALALAGWTAPAAAQEKAERPLILATTTSTQDTGLLDDLLPRFTAATSIKVKTVAVGSGEALAMGKRGDADVLLVHSKAAEDEFMAEGYGAERFDVMYNDFVVVGPADDPAGVKDKDAVTAFKAIAAKGARFITREDKSGTHKKELELWKKAGVEVKGQPWYVATGQGMGETARITSEKQGYTLIDRGTWLALQATLKLQIVSEGSKDLLNTYRVIVVNPEKNPKTNVGAARHFARWLITPEVQRVIGEFGKAKFGQPLFVPNAGGKGLPAPPAK